MEATVKHIVLDEYFSRNANSVDFNLRGNEERFSGQNGMIRALQDEVLGVLPSRCFFSGSSFDASKIGNGPSSLSSTQNCACGSNTVKATLFETSGVNSFLFAASSKSSDDRLTRRVSFSLKLPPFILWLNFDLVKMALDISREVVNCDRLDTSGAEFSSAAFEEKHRCYPPPNVPVASWKGSVGGSIFLPQARIILCFPFKNTGGYRSYISCNQFIAVDFSSPSNFGDLKGEESVLVRESISWKNYSPSPSHSVHLNVVNLDVYHITCSVVDHIVRSTESESRQFYSYKILSLGNGTHWVGLISMLWREDAKTGAWIMKSAKSLVTSDGPASKVSSATSDYDFASVSTREHKGDSSSQKQKELILSSKFCIHICVPAVVVTLCRSEYLSVFHLLNHAMDALSSAGGDTAYDIRGTSVNQSSVVLECGLVEVYIELEQGDGPKSSLERELPGSWHKLRLEIQYFQLLSVADVGAVNDATFLWVSHREGKLWGSVTSMADQDILLISCFNSSNGRGDGEGSNVLSCNHAGTDFMHLSDPESFHNFMSIVLKCGTIVAPGGRLDWLDKIICFVSLPSPEIGETADCNGKKAEPQNVSLLLKFTDGALSYEPYFSELGVNGECLNPKSRISIGLDDNRCDPYVACLLAASSLTLSSTMVAGSLENDYHIRLRDVGLLLHEASKQEKVVGEYGVGHLHELGYVKIAGEAVVDAILRINCENDVYWDLTCSESHVVFSTCHDTTLGLIRLASQIQQLFAPDIEESLVHLQNRWNSSKQVQGEEDDITISETSSNSSPRILQAQQLAPDSKVESRLANLMGEISEDAFLFCQKTMNSLDRSEFGAVEGIDGGICHERHSVTYPYHENYMEDGHSPILQKSKIMEGYSLSGLRSLSELTVNSHFTEGNIRSNSDRGNVDVQRGKSGWYGSNSLRIFENYVPDRTSQSRSKQLLEGQQNLKEDNVCERFKGRLSLRNVDIKWRMYAGSDWHDLGKTVRHSEDIYGRDGSVCLELALSNMNIHCDIFPDGDLCVSKLCLSIQDLHLYDKSRNAPWKLV